MRLVRKIQEGKGWAAGFYDLRGLLLADPDRKISNDEIEDGLMLEGAKGNNSWLILLSSLDLKVIAKAAPTTREDD